MGIISYKTEVVGMVGVNPTIIFIETDDNTDEIEAAGYLNGIYESGTSLNPRQMALVSHTTVAGARNVEWYRVTKSGTDWTLVPTVSSFHQEYPALVGVTSGYDTVKEAVDAGESNIVVLASVAETAPIAPTSSVSVLLAAGVSWTLGLHWVDMVSCPSFKLEGDGGAALNFGYSVAGSPFRNIGAAATLNLADIAVNDGSTIDGTPLNDSGILTISNVTYTLPGTAGNGIKLNDERAHAANIHLIGANASTSGCVDMTAGQANDISLSGTFSLTVPIIAIGSDSMLHGLSREPLGGAGAWQIQCSGIVTSMDGQGGGRIVLGSNAMISNIQDVVIDVTSANYCIMTGIRGSLFHNGQIPTNGHAISDLILNQGFTVSGDNNVINNFEILNSGSVCVVSGSLNMITQGIIGDTPGAGGSINFSGTGQQNFMDKIIMENATTDTSTGAGNYIGLADGVTNVVIGTIAPRA